MENNAANLEIAWAAQRCGRYHTAINWHLTAGEVLTREPADTLDADECESRPHLIRFNGAGERR